MSVLGADLMKRLCYQHNAIQLQATLSVAFLWYWDTSPLLFRSVSRWCGKTLEKQGPWPGVVSQTPGSVPPPSGSFLPVLQPWLAVPILPTSLTWQTQQGTSCPLAWACWPPRGKLWVSQSRPAMPCHQPPPYKHAPALAVASVLCDRGCSYTLSKDLGKGE